MAHGNSIIYSVEPQRASQRGWELCLPHQAQRFAIVQLKKWRQGGKNMRVARVMQSFSGRGAEGKANDAIASLTAARKPRPVPKTPGSRFAPSGRPIIARSLTTTEWLERRGQ